MSHKKRNYRKRDLVEDEGETSAPVKISDDPSGSLSRLSFADEEVLVVPKQTAKPKRPKETSSAATATTAATEQSIEPASIASQQDDPIVLLKCAKKKLSVRRLPDRGRGVCAEEDISAGQTLLEEDSYAAVVDDNNLSRRCSGCFGEAKKLSRCSACKVVHYCSSVCQKRDWVTSHQEECKAFVKVGRPVPTAIRVVSRILRRRQRDRESAREIPASLSIYSIFHTLYSEVENLENRMYRTNPTFELLIVLLISTEELHEYNSPPIASIQLQTFAQIAMVVRDCVTEAAMPSASETIDLWCRVSRFCHPFLRIEQSISVSHQITPYFSILDGEMVDVGVGVYPATAMINHSCWPNCVVVFEGARILVRSIRPIKRGEEITQSYIDIAEPVSRRRADLRQRYFFLCQCELCERTSKVLSDVALAG
ncbi:hypothetical protein BC938DRAFT_471730 [Jimgerdemannia flammicorona]|uniref:SET domain-containing protein n=1 Tax=Jimgerdemannia flammicorona TaxID=994334 RepID=A0A433QUF5_9FUNG|nr:hypothetical protein BC938DRAFT_471730 [Jimgerdemannia flammicorona]